MFTLERDEAFKVWEQWFSELQHSWFKLEVLQDYTGEDQGPSLNAWLAGDKSTSMKLTEPWNSSWAKLCRAKVEKGVQLERIHVIDETLSPYLEWEIELYKRQNIPLGGEKVFLVQRSDIAKLELPAGDLMIFDDARAVVNTYDKTGFVTHETFYDATDDISNFRMLRDSIMIKANRVTP